MSIPITFKRTVEVKVEDCNGFPILEGSVLRSIEPDDDGRGVVTAVIKKGDWGYGAERIGDLRIWEGDGCHRITNQYSKWEHIPKGEQTYLERFKSWEHSGHFKNYNESISDDEHRAISGIMALFPEDPIDYDYGPFADRIEDALEFMAKHLDQKNAEL